MTSSDNPRLFVAVVPPPPALEHLAKVVDDLEVSQGEQAADRLTLRPGWHLTAAFLGPVPASRVAETAAIVAGCAERAAAVIRLRLAGGSTFGSGDHQILWVGVDGETAGLDAFAAVLRRELTVARLMQDRRDFHPHLTITRPGIRIPARLIATDVARLGSYVGPLWSVERVQLMESVRTPTPLGERSTYRTLSSAGLGPVGSA